jgi:hypothetical protein
VVGCDVWGGVTDRGEDTAAPHRRAAGGVQRRGDGVGRRELAARRRNPREVADGSLEQFRPSAQLF